MSESRAEQTGTRILIAEDDPDFRDALALWLSDYDNAEITTASNGQEAMEALDSTIDLFLCDQRMPQLTGPEIIERMRQEDYDVPTIVISAYDPNFEGHSDSVDRHLSKPIDQAELLEAVDQLLTD